MISTSKLRRTRTQSLRCSSKRSYQDEPTARRCLWAIGQQRRINVDRLTVMRCLACGAWHVGRVR